MSISRGSFMAARIACLVTALKATRLTLRSFLRAFFCSRICRMCQEMASPSRSGSVARINLSAPLTASVISFMIFWDLASTSQCISKSLSGSTDPFFEGKSRTCPKDGMTLYPLPRYLLMVLAFAADSTITTFISDFQAGCARLLARPGARRFLSASGAWLIRSGREHGRGMRRCQTGTRHNLS